MKHGWNADTVLDEVQRRLGYKFDPAEAEEVPADVFRDHVGIHRQKQLGLSYVGASVLRGRTSADQLFAAADLADRFGSGEVRTTTMQNLIFVNVPNAKAGALATELNTLGLQMVPSVFWRGAVACTGTEFCKLAITETKAFTRWVVEELEVRIPEFNEQLRLNVTGCPNSCGQHWIADLGLEGKKLKIDGKLQDAFYFCVGGSVGRQQAIARPVGYRAAASEVPEAIERLLRSYLELRTDGENLRQFFARHSNEAIRAFLAGTPAEAVQRDLPPGPVPHGVEA
jgi:sulfite reductase (ferredoxin)